MWFAQRGRTSSWKGILLRVTITCGLWSPWAENNCGPSSYSSSGATHSPARDRTLQELGLHYGTQWSLLPSFGISKRTLSPCLSIQRNFYLQVHGILIGKLWNLQHPQKTFLGQLCFKLTHPQLPPYHHSAPGGTFELNQYTLWV